LVVVALVAFTWLPRGGSRADWVQGPEVTLAFAGDVNFFARTAKILDDPKTAFGAVVDTLASADLALVNLETPITRQTRAEPRRYLFRTDERAVDALLAGGIDAVSLANNHTRDYGSAGLADTINAARAGGLPTFGAGRNAAEAFAPWRTTVRGVRIAVLGFSQVTNHAGDMAAHDDRPGVAMAFDEQRALAAVSAARAGSDVVIVVAHWGTEHVQCPNRVQKYFARQLADAGADIIVGAHAHVLQGAGWLDRAYVAYGMGNFLWYSSGLVPADNDTGILKLTLRGRTVLRQTLVPAVVSDTGQPVPVTGAAADARLKHFASLRDCAGLAARRPWAT
jgi:poly-gamma-glutamate synthesis protein (capsule biosynthesis protein)